MADAPPGTPTPPASRLKIPMSREECGAWTARIEAATKAADAKRKEWQAYVTSYMVRTPEIQIGPDHQITVPLEFAYVELKKAQLAFQVPEVNLKPKRPEYANATRAFEGALNHELGESGADQLLDLVLTDVLLCGIAAAKVGYYADIRSRPVPVMAPAVDPMTGQPGPEAPQIDPMTGEPMMRDEPYIAHECYYGDQIPPENLLFPPEFTGGDYDRAAYLGHRFQLDVRTAIQRYGLDPTFMPTATRPMETLSSAEQSEGRDTLTTKDVEGVELFYLATVFDQTPDDAAQDAPTPFVIPGVPFGSPDRPHVGQYRRVVFLKGKSEPVVHEDSPYQYIDEVDGKLKGMKGNPIHVLTLRVLPGSPYPVSDVQAGRPASEEVSLGRSQMMNFRERVMPVLGIDRTRANPELQQKLLANADVKIGAVIGVDGPPNEIVTPISVTQFPRDNFKFDEVARGDFELAWSMGARQAGQDVPGEPITAEEVRMSQGATDTRLAREQTRVLKWWTTYAEKFGALLQMFKDEPSYAEITGDDGAKALQAWNRKGGDGIASIAGEFVFTARPDSALRLDAQADRQQKTQLYTQLGNDPNVNRVELLKAVLMAYSLDPEKVVVEQLPEKGPEPPKISWSFKGEDLQVIDPKTGQPNTAFPLVISIAEQGGIKIPPEAIQNAMLLAQQLTAQMAALAPAPMMGAQPALGPGPETEHPGATTPVEPLNKHMADRGDAAMPEASPPSAPPNAIM